MPGVNKNVNTVPTGSATWIRLSPLYRWYAPIPTG